ncbi:MAG TPA: YbhB/YbcL family Raf kinase inhibitor-like protein [Gammaproteobacteria bacterium]|nr:YbhB/YbcL family Raf kinase inhibitor-like protein [Gammaproteobacteria bacterium]
MGRGLRLLRGICGGAVAALVLLPGWGAGGVALGAEGGDLQLSSPAFHPNGSIPTRYACDGSNISPPLKWSGSPRGTRSLALIVDDPDAPGQVWVHWVAYNLPPEAGGLGEGASGSLPGSAREGRNSWGTFGYGGPCPPSGTHRYRFKLYALDTRLDLRTPDKSGLLEAIKGHILDRVELTARYAK